MRRKKMWKVILVILVVLLLLAFYTKRKNSKVEAEYKELFSESCNFAIRGLTSINSALNSDNLSYAEKLKTIQDSEWELEVASKYLESIEQLNPGFHINPPDEMITSQFLKRYVDTTLEDAIYIGIAQEDYESQANGTADDGLRAIKGRLDDANTFCKKYKD